MIKKNSANGIDNLVYLDGKALYFLRMDNPFRILLFNLVTNIKFDYFIIFVILISSI